MTRVSPKAQTPINQNTSPLPNDASSETSKNDKVTGIQSENTQPSQRVSPSVTDMKTPDLTFKSRLGSVFTTGVGNIKKNPISALRSIWKGIALGAFVGLCAGSLGGPVAATGGLFLGAFLGGLASTVQNICHAYKNQVPLETSDISQETSNDSHEAPQQAEREALINLNNKEASNQNLNKSSPSRYDRECAESHGKFNSPTDSPSNAEQQEHYDRDCAESHGKF